MLFRRKLKRQRAYLSAVADRICARNGSVLKEEFSGGRGPNGPLTLGVITLRNGESAEVLRAQIDAAVAAGYAEPPRRQAFNGAGFVRNPGLPMLTVETFAAGTVIPHHGQVPPGQTGVVVSLT
ncbi:hypothetical protein ACWED2_09880 [Amycolatopsis sp. NPDC005003]